MEEIQEIYEIQNKGKGVISFSSEDELLLIYSKQKQPEKQNLGETLTEGDTAVNGKAYYDMGPNGLETTTTENSFGIIQSSILRLPPSLVQLSNFYSENGGSNSIQGQFNVDAGKVSIRQNTDGFSGKTILVEFQDPIANNVKLLFPAKTLNGNYIFATLDDIPFIDGSETKLQSSATVSISGSGKVSDPYIANIIQQPSQKTITYPADFVSFNYTLTSADDGKLIIVENATNDVTITVGSGLPNEFFTAVLRDGTGEISFVTSGGTTINNSISGLKINRRYDQVALDKKGNTNVFYLTGNVKV